MALSVALTLALGAAIADAQEREKAAGKAPKPPCDCDVWCGLFAAQPDESEIDASEEADHLLDQLQIAFPEHRSFRLIGENSEKVFKEYECWIVPSKQLFLKIDSLGTHPDKSGGVHVHLQLWQKDHVLLKSETILRRQPVFIAGPKWGEKGQLIMVLKLMEKTIAPK
ncbi:MAG: hypothetical protein KDN19_18775 [Verrucomicrobiae bacterium]|nr:hypothetical protein [Verrucomicrobiae bacterium]